MAQISSPVSNIKNIFPPDDQKVFDTFESSMTHMVVPPLLDKRISLADSNNECVCVHHPTFRPKSKKQFSFKNHNCRENLFRNREWLARVCFVCVAFYLNDELKWESWHLCVRQGKAFYSNKSDKLISSRVFISEAYEMSAVTLLKNKDTK